MFNHKKISFPMIFTTFFSYSTNKTLSPCTSSRYTQCLKSFSYLLTAVYENTTWDKNLYALLVGSYHRWVRYSRVSLYVMKLYNTYCVPAREMVWKYLMLTQTPPSSPVLYSRKRWSQRASIAGEDEKKTDLFFFQRIKQIRKHSGSL